MVDLLLVANSLAMDLAAVTPAIPPPITAILGGGGPSLGTSPSSSPFVEESSAVELVAVAPLLLHPNEKALMGAIDGTAPFGGGIA